MNPRWKIRRELRNAWSVGQWDVWALYLDGKEVTSYFLWENALTHVDNWYQDQALRSAS